MSTGNISVTGEPISGAMCRFTVDRPLYPDRSSAFHNKEEARSSPLAERLFEIDGIETAIRAAVPAVGDVLDVTDHAAGRNPYYTPSKK